MTTNNIIRLLVLLVILYALDFVVLGNIIVVSTIISEILIEFKNKMKGGEQ